MIYLDFEKAFVKVPHIRLLRKVEAHGICGNILKWIGEWLTARQQRVVLNGYELMSQHGYMLLVVFHKGPFLGPCR